MEASRRDAEQVKLTGFRVLEGEETKAHLTEDVLKELIAAKIMPTYKPEEQLLRGATDEEKDPASEAFKTRLRLLNVLNTQAGDFRMLSLNERKQKLQMQTEEHNLYTIQQKELDDLNKLKKMIEKRHVFIALATSEEGKEKVAAIASYGNIEQYGGRNTCWIGATVTLPKFQKRGIFSDLSQRVLEAIKTKMPDGIIMTSTSSNSVIGKKKAAGFTVRNPDYFTTFCGEGDNDMIRREVYHGWTHMAWDSRE
ncbi:MAG: hypothetical protein P1V18_01255 [Candidatus Gracilibacteria bacterium]|nr:hypothetical protein [Candidatus Gracilibacteria bacterium]